MFQIAELCIVETGTSVLFLYIKLRIGEGAECPICLSCRSSLKADCIYVNL